MRVNQCNYEIDGISASLDFISLIKHYYEKTSVLKNSNLYSSDQIVDSVVNELKKQLDQKDDIINNVITDVRGNKVQLNRGDIVSVLDFIVANNLQIFEQIGITQSQLSPEYIEENRILNFIKNSLKEEGIATKEEDKLIDLLNLHPDKVGLLHKEIKSIIEIEKRTNEIGRVLHRTLNKLVLDEGDISRQNISELRKVLEESKDFLEGNVEDWLDNFNKILKQIYSTITSKGRVLSEVWLRSNQLALGQVKGAIDIVVVDDSGNVHIYDLKISKNKYENWDSAKKLTTDWQLAFYRALLGQHVPISGSELNIISIVVGDYNQDNKLELKNLRLEPIRNRLADESGKPLQIVNKDLSSDYIPGKLTLGKMYILARRLIPESKKMDYNTERSDKIKNDLSLIFPDYNSKIKKSKLDVETELKKAIRSDGFYSIYSDFVHEGAIIGKNGWIGIDSKTKDGRLKTLSERETELRTIIEHYITFVNNNEDQLVSRLRNSISQAIQNQSLNKIDMSNPQESLFVRGIINRYVNGDYILVGNSEELTSLGLILLQNVRRGSYIIISVTSNNLLTNYDDNYSVEDIEIIKSLIFFNNFKSELQLDLNKIEDIEVFNIYNKKSKLKTLDNVFEKYKEALSSKVIVNNLSDKSFLNFKERAEELVRQEHRRAFIELPESDKIAIQEIFDKYDEASSNLSLFQLKDIVKSLIKLYPELEQKTFVTGFDFNSPIERLFAYIQVLLLAKAEIIPEGDFDRLNNYNIRFSNMRTFVSGLFSKDINTYDKNERKLGSLIEGLKTTTPDKVKSKDLQSINGIINGTNNRIGNKIIYESNLLNKFTEKYYKDINYNVVSETVIGNHRDKFRNLWVTKDGKISDEWKVKNPYDTESTLSEGEREYLKNLLFRMYINTINISKADYDKIDISSLESINKTAPESMIDKINKGIYFEMPIVRSQQWNRYGKMREKGFSGLIDTFKAMGHELYDYVDGRQLEMEEIENYKRESGFYEMYDTYGKQSREFIQNKIHEKGEAYWELDLDAIAHRYIFSKVRKKYLDNVLPVINAYVWWIKISAGKQNLDISNELEYVSKRLKVAAKDEHIIEEDFKDVISLVAAAKKITTTAMLAFRPTLLFKEMIIGLYKNYMLAATQMLGKDQFTISDLTAAIKKLATIDNKFSAKRNLIDLINSQYRFANLEISITPRRYQTNRKVGFFMGFGKWMFAMNTIPDHYNRLSLFLAKMIHDGSYEAHTKTEDGFLVYDPKKDKRFSYYFENRHKHKNSKGEYISAKDDEKYNKQRNLYRLLIDQLNKEGKLQNDEHIDEEQLVDKAYSDLERNSYKSFTDTVYGYYDKDSQAEWHNTWFGVVYLQFLQFWPGKMSLWFGSEYNKNLTPIGKHVQKKDKDGNLLWRRPKNDNPLDPEEITDWEITTEDTSDPVLEWQGTVQEGLYYSMLYTLRDVIKGDWSEIKNNEGRNRRAIYGLAEGFLMIAFFKFIWMLLTGWIEENGTDGIDGETIAFMESVNRKVLNEANVLDNTFGALRSQPAFWTYTTRVSQDMYDVMTGTNSKTPQKILARNFRAFEFWDNE